MVLEANGEREAAAAELALAFRQNPHFTSTHRAEATTLAARLGVAVPLEWGAATPQELGDEAGVVATV